MRVDGDESIGCGHLARCLALGRQALEDGFRVRVATTDLDDRWFRRLKEAGIEPLLLDAERGSREDAEALATRAMMVEPDWIVVDGYPFDVAYRRRLRSALDGTETTVLMIDDLGADGEGADLVLNHNMYATPAMYPDVDESVLLLGSRYLLLRPEFDAWEEWERRIDGEIESILVVGGGDPDEKMPRVVAGLSQIVDDSVHVDVVGIDEAACVRRVPEASRFTYCGNVDAVADLMADADVAVSTGGNLAWELLFMQLPGIIVPVVDNQRRSAEAIAELPGYLRLDNPDRHSELRRHLERLDAAELRKASAESAASIVDGAGPRRVVRIMKSWKCLGLRGVRPDDCRMLWDWADAPEVRAQAFDSTPIPWEEHRGWFADKMVDDDTLIYIGEHRDGRPIGQVRFEVDDRRDAEISIVVDREFRSGGYGWMLLRAAMQAAPDDIETFHAYVKPENAASLNLFQSLGFEVAGETQRKGCRAIHFVR